MIISRATVLALTAIVLLVIAGILLHVLWPLQSISITVGLDLGLVMVGLGVVTAIGVTMSSMWRRLRVVEVRVREANDSAAEWEEHARSRELAHARFMRELDHELKNPLQAIKLAFADLEQSGGLTDSLQTARTQVERIRLLIGRLRRIASVTPGSLALEAVDLRELVDDAIELAGSTNPGCADRLRIVVPQAPWRLVPVRADRDLAAHAIFNLLENAFKYSPDSSVVEVRLKEDYSGASIEVVDDGIGIDPADLPHITEELYRSDRTNWIEGSGLGLALVQRVAAAHNGRLDLRSQPGEGTVASLRLPLAEPNASRG